MVAVPSKQGVRVSNPVWIAQQKQRKQRHHAKAPKQSKAPARRPYIEDGEDDPPKQPGPGALRCLPSQVACDFAY